MFYAVLMSGSDWKKCPTSDAAWAYIMSRRCYMCLDALAMRPYEKTADCDAEWDVWTEEDFEQFGPLPPEGEIL